MSSKSKFAILVGTVAAWPVLAQASPDWRDPQRISDVVITTGGAIAIVPGVNNPVGCSVPSHLHITTGTPNYKTMAAALLSAHAQGKAVRFFAASCAGDGAVLIQGVWTM